MNTYIRNQEYAVSVMEGIRETVLCDFYNSGAGSNYRPMDIDALILLINEGYLACEIKHVNNTEVTTGEALTILSISYFPGVLGNNEESGIASDDNRASYWAKLAHFEDTYSMDSLYVIKYGQGNRIIYTDPDLENKKTLKELIQELNSEMMQNGTARLDGEEYKSYSPFRVNFAYQFNDQGILFGFMTVGDEEFTDSVMLAEELTDYLTAAGCQSYVLLAHADNLNSEGRVYLEDAKTVRLYTGGKEWGLYDKSPKEFIDQRNIQVPERITKKGFHPEFLNETDISGD